MGEKKQFIQTSAQKNGKSNTIASVIGSVWSDWSFCGGSSCCLTPPTGLSTEAVPVNTGLMKLPAAALALGWLSGINWLAALGT